MLHWDINRVINELTMTDPYSFSLLRLVVSKRFTTEYLVMKLVDEGVSLLGTDSVIIVGTDVSNE